ncbi:MAG: hypothetical protein ACJAXS_000487 [Colwellia sp.]|jgi:uncharacterized protein (DUF2141 family)
MRLLYVFFLYIISTNLAFSEPKNHGTLTVIVNSAQSNNGNIEVHILANQAQFDNEIPAFLICRMIVKELKSTCEFRNVPYGNYVIFAFHDRNLDQHLNTNFFEEPTEKMSITGIDLAENSSPNFKSGLILFNSMHGQVYMNLQ